MVVFERWTGKESRALREARRMTVAAFAEHIRVSDRTIWSWERSSMKAGIRVSNQAALESSLSELEESERELFYRLLKQAEMPDRQPTGTDGDDVVDDAFTGNDVRTRMAVEQQLDGGSYYAGPSGILLRASHTISAAQSMLIGDETHQRLVTDLIDWARTMNRRDVLQWLAWAAQSALSAMPMLTNLDSDERERTIRAIAQPERFDEMVAGHIEAILWRAMRQDDALGPQAALDTVLSQREIVKGIMVGAPSEDTRKRLITLFANLSRFAGWLAFDLGNYNAANRYYEEARSAAHEARNTELGVLVLCNMSHLATWRGQPRVGIDHAVAAQGWAMRISDPKLLAYAYDVAARAFARDGAEKAAMTSIEHAEAALAGDNIGYPSEWAYFFSAGQLLSTKSACLLSLGKADQAATLAQESLNRIDAPFVRNIAMTSVYLGVAHLRKRRPAVAEGAAALDDAIRLSVHNRSVRLVQALQEALQRLMEWNDEPRARRTLELARSYGLL